LLNRYNYYVVDFIGSKIALFFNGELLVYLRDNKPGLKYANKWDFPGGGREGNESPRECVIREVQEEFGINLSPRSITWERPYPAMHYPGKIGYFLVGGISGTQVSKIKFGDEGQYWKFMKPEEFLSHKDVLTPLKGRLRDYLSEVANAGRF
jgi:8-oxo-dGTP diphosphatase